MKTSNKIKLANLTTWTMVITISFVALFFVGFIATNTFDLNVFTNRASNFIYSFIGFASVVILCSAILNVSLNISLIADNKIQEFKTNDSGAIGRKFIFYCLGIVIILVSFLFIGDYITRQNEKQKLFDEANDIISRYQSSIDRITIGLSDTSKIGDVPDVLNFLSNQKEEFPSVSLLTTEKYDGQLTFLEIDQYHAVKTLKKQFYGDSFYKCQSQDCDYLNSYFTGKTTEKYFWTEKNNYKLYFPFIAKDRKYILLFTKYQRHGKVGSRG